MARVGRRIVVATLAVALAMLFVEALWLRVCGLGAMPEVNGDEAFFGLMAGRAVLGRNVPLLTYSGNIPNPFYTLPLAPLIAAFGPKFWVLRLPCLISGMLAVVVAFTVGRQLFDRPTAIVLATLIAIMPPLVLYGGLGLEFSQSALFGLLAISCAFRAKPFRLLLAFLICFLVHPTNAFLLPILSGVFAASAWKRCESAEATRRLLLIVAALSTLAAMAIGAYAAWRGLLAPGRQGGALGQELDWGQYLAGLAKFTTGIPYFADPPSDSWVTARVIGFWGLAGLALLRLPIWVTERNWERLALVIGLAFGIGGLHLFAGPGVFIVDTMRYGVVFLAPMAVAMALGLAPWISGRMAESLPRVRLLAALPLLGLAFVPLQDARNHVLVNHARRGGGNLGQPWKVRGPLERAFEQIAAEEDSGSPARSGRRRIIVAQDWWIQKPMEYLALARPNWRIVAFDQFSADEVIQQRRLSKLMDQGAIVVGRINQKLDRTALTLATDSNSLLRYEIRHGSLPALAILQLNPREGGPDQDPSLAGAPGADRK